MIVKYESDQKKITIAALERENALKEKLAGNQRSLIFVLLVGLILISGVGFFYFRNLARRRKLEKKLLLQEEKFKTELQQQKEQQLLSDFNKQLAEVQLTALNAQMNPHFIFNCMNSIQKYILKNEKSKALEFLQNFSELMRSVLDNSAKTKIGLDEEINMLEKYVLLERQRLDNKFDYHIEVDPGLQADFFEIPGMIMQPYVENAIWHGLMNLAESSNGHPPRNGVLKLSFSKENATIRCMVEDNGVGRKKAALMEKDRSPQRKSYGMAIANKRLELLQKEIGKLPDIVVEDLYTDNEPAGTRVTVYMNVD
jgi:LytS/YehU family sensor histidine kinase